MKNNVREVLPANTAESMRGLRRHTERAPRIRRSSWSPQRLVSLALIVFTACGCRPACAASLMPLLTDGSCSLGWFPCGDNGTLCLEQRFFCDLQRHCPAGEDESDCLDNKADTHLTQRILNKPVLRWEDRHKCSK
ncbi:uncharacterized protein [Palaemon carinicauda]|uniref:uncharacterized protein isoform X1 n=1 Tax=Palaemon carinicauda TaxID=392227 RepID=UPI0035B607D5